MCNYLFRNIGELDMYGDRNFGGRRGGFSPVNVGEETDVKIEAVGEKGNGIAKVKGSVLFVPGVKEGDEVRIKVTKVLRNVGFAEVVGQAEGPVGEDTQEEAAPAEEDTDTPSEEAALEEEANPEDSEDFGEEETAEEEPKEEAEAVPEAEEETADAPAEEEAAPEESEEEKKEE